MYIGWLNMFKKIRIYFDKTKDKFMPKTDAIIDYDMGDIYMCGINFSMFPDCIALCQFDI